MKRPLLWLGLCLALLLGGVAWISVTALRSDAAAARARWQAAVEEGARLALWRLDSDVAPLLSHESSQAPQLYGRLPGTEGELVLLRFEVGADGQLRARGDDERRARFQAIGTRAGLLDAIGTWCRPPAVDGLISAPTQQADRNANEYVKRSRSVAQAQNAMPAALFDAQALPHEAMLPVWASGELLLVRRVTVDGEDLLQGAWIDWPALRRKLLAEIADLFPGAALEPALPGAQSGARLLASLPLRLIPGAPAVPPVAEGAPVALVLGGAWAAVLVAAAALVLLLVGTVALSERRAAFVSAVTHELRTPLTTLRTYTEMLAGGMVREEKRPGYLATLAREAERLARLVDNVLLYARLERGRGPARALEVDCARLLDDIKPRLEERAAAAGMSVDVSAPDGLVVRADPLALEQIVFNLVDNACKYGSGTVCVAATAEGRGAAIRVSDDGAGIAAEDRPLLFEPFARSAERAAGSAPGVGLGLALARRLARAMGGELALEDGARAKFVVRLRKKQTGDRRPATGNRQ